MQNTFLKEKPIPHLVRSMSIPVVLSMFIQSLYNIVDSIWVAQLGTDAITAVSLAFPLQNIILSVGVGMGVGVGSLLSMALGAGHQEEANRIASLGVFLTLIHCLIFIGLGLVITRPFLALFTSDPQILGWSCDYTYIVLLLSFGELLQMCFEKIFQGLGRMKTTMFLMASGCVINIVLDPVLIFGWFGFPALGVAGAALATVIGQIAAMFLYVIVYCRQHIGITIRLRDMKPQGSIIRRIYGIGGPSSLMLSMPSLLTGILNGILTQFDAVYVAVFGLYYKLQTFVNMPANGVIQGMRPIISYNYGAGEHARVTETIRYGLRLIACIMLIGTLAALLIPGPILRIFDADETLLAYGVPALRIIGPSFLLSSVGIVASGVFEALGRGRSSLLISLLRQLIIIVPLGWILSRWIGPIGIWIAFPAAELVSSLVAVRMLRSVTMRKESSHEGK